MEAEDIIGKEITCFKFESDDRLKWNFEYDSLIGKTGTVLKLNDSYPQYARVKVHTTIGKIVEKHFPTQMIKEQLEKIELENKSTEELLNDMKQLISRL
jgi:hypothetical protein